MCKSHPQMAKLLPLQLMQSLKVRIPQGLQRKCRIQNQCLLFNIIFFLSWLTFGR